jgi:chromosomal replication initiator protein
VSKTQKNAINVAFIHSDRFAFLYIKAIRENKLTEFKEIFYNLDVLLFDDIQIIASKKSTINEFYFIVNHLLSRGKIVAITSNVPLTSLKLDIKILSFLHSGYIVDIKNPSIHLRREIIIKFAMDLNIIISDEIVTYLATNLYSNIREIEATMTKIAMFFTVKKQAMTINAIKMMLQDTVKNNIKTISTKDIISAVCDKLSVDKQDLLSDSRQRNISQARKIAMYLMKSLTTMSLKQITESLKRKSHVSVIQAIKDMELEQKNNTNIAVIIDEISHFLKS